MPILREELGSWNQFHPYFVNQFQVFLFVATWNEMKLPLTVPNEEWFASSAGYDYLCFWSKKSAASQYKISRPTPCLFSLSLLNLLLQASHQSTQALEEAIPGGWGEPLADKKKKEKMRPKKSWESTFPNFVTFQQLLSMNGIGQNKTIFIYRGRRSLCGIYLSFRWICGNRRRKNNKKWKMEWSGAS